jgi:hypothetical protein
MEPGSCRTPRFPRFSRRLAGATSGATSRELAQCPDRLSVPLVRELSVPLVIRGSTWPSRTWVRMAQVVQAEVGDPGLPKGRRPRLRDAGQPGRGLMVPKHVVSLEMAQQAAELLEEGVIDRNAPGLAALGAAERIPGTAGSRPRVSPSRHDSSAATFDLPITFR